MKLRTLLTLSSLAGTVATVVVGSFAVWGSWTTWSHSQQAVAASVQVARLLTFQQALQQERLASVAFVLGNNGPTLEGVRQACDAASYTQSERGELLALRQQVNARQLDAVNVRQAYVALADKLIEQGADAIETVPSLVHIALEQRLEVAEVQENLSRQLDYVLVAGTTTNAEKRRQTLQALIDQEEQLQRHLTITLANTRGLRLADITNQPDLVALRRERQRLLDESQTLTTTRVGAWFDQGPAVLKPWQTLNQQLDQHVTQLCTSVAGQAAWQLGLTLSVIIVGLGAVWGCAYLISRHLRDGIRHIQTLAVQQATLQLGQPHKQTQGHDEISGITHDLVIGQDNLVALLGHARAGVNRLDTTAEDLRQLANTLLELGQVAMQSSTGVAAASQETATALNSVATANEELMVASKEIARHVSHTTQMASEAHTLAERSVAEADTLQQASRKIADVLALVRSIAEQTNLLALNATIEAARAGEAGRGFAVVANEVKNLASRTAAAVSEVDGQVQAISNGIRATVETIHQLAATNAKVGELQQSVSSAVEQQHATHSEVTRNLSESANGAAESGRLAEDASSKARELMAIAQHVSAGASALARTAYAIDRQVMVVRLPGDADIAVQWSQRIAVQHELIDRQHTELFRRLERALAAFAAPVDPTPALQPLEQYVQEHFAYEQQLMHHHAYPQRDEHLAQHADFIQHFRRLSTMAADPQQRGPQLRTAAEVHLYAWLVEHIAVADAKLTTFLGQPHPPAHASSAT